MQMAKLAATPSKLRFARRAENREWITVQASYFSMEMYNFLLFSARRSLASILIFVVRVNTFVCSHENEFLDVIASVMHSAGCSLGGEVINGSSHSVCSRQALLLPLPHWATCTSLTPSQEESNVWLRHTNGNESGKEGGGGPRRRSDVRGAGEMPIERPDQKRDEVELKKRSNEKNWEESQSRKTHGGFQPSTHQRAWLLRCLVGVKSRRTDCSQ